MDCKVNKITFFYEKSATAKTNSRENSKYDQFSKINTREKSKFLQFAKINTREIHFFFLTRENKYLRKLVLRRYLLQNENFVRSQSIYTNLKFASIFAQYSIFNIYSLPGYIPL